LEYSGEDEEYVIRVGTQSGNDGPKSEPQKSDNHHQPVTEEVSEAAKDENKCADG
jgi:hypothetical protein